MELLFESLDCPQTNSRKQHIIDKVKKAITRQGGIKMESAVRKKGLGYIIISSSEGHGSIAVEMDPEEIFNHTDVMPSALEKPQSNTSHPLIERIKAQVEKSGVLPT